MTGEGPGDRVETDPGVEEVLTALEEALRRARSVPFSGTALVDRSGLLELLARAREGLPAELVQADDVLAEADRVLADAHQEAERIVAEASRRAAELVEAQPVVVDARNRVRQLVADAEQEAEQHRREADEYGDARLADLEIEVGRVLAQVQAGRARLAGRFDGED